MDRPFRRLLVVTTGLTFALVLLGVYTAASGAGLTCDARWPLCDGAVFGLFPANWPSFVEWLHRLVAMVTGLFILGTALLAWRRPVARRLRGALTVAVVLLPAQIGMGALTVTQYEWLILAAHFVTALVIFTGVSLAALWAGASGHDRADREAAVAAAVAAAALVPFALLSPRLLVVFDATAQVVYYACGLGGYVALLAAATWSGGRPRTVAGAAAAVLFALLVVGRQTYGDLVTALTLVGALIAFVLAVGVAWWLHRADEASATGPSHDPATKRL